MADGVVALVDYQVDSTKLSLIKDIFWGAVSENEESELINRRKKLLTYNLYVVPFFLIFGGEGVSTNK